MRLTDVRWRTLHSDIRVGGRDVRVVQPARVPKHAALYEGYLGAQMLVDKPAAMDLAARPGGSPPDLRAPPSGSHYVAPRRRAVTTPGSSGSTWS